MPTITQNTTFIDGEVLLASKLNTIAGNATISDIAESDITNGAITADKLASSAVTNAKILAGTIALDRINNIAGPNVLGNMSGTTGAVGLVEVKDDDLMTAASATALATQQSIKAYVDAEIAAVEAEAPTYSGGESAVMLGGLIIKMGSATNIPSNSGTSGGKAVSFGAAFPNGIVAVVATISGGSADNEPQHLSVYSKTVNGFTIGTAANSSTVDANWIAIGY